MVAAFHSAQSRSVENRDLLHDPHDQNHPIWGPASQTYAALCNGAGAVIFFFVLSGFVLSLSLERGPSEIAPAARRFFVRRLFRLYPAVLSTVLLFAALFWIFGVRIPTVPPSCHALVSLLRNMLLLDTNIDGVMWALQLELIAAPMIFAVVFMQRRWGTAPTLLLAVLLIALSFASEWNRILGPSAPPSMGRLYAFLFGVLLHRFGPPLARCLPGRSAAVFFSLMVIIFFVARPIVGKTSQWSALVECFAAAGMIAVLVFCENTDFARPLDAGFFRFYGKLSFSFYLLHPLTLSVLWNNPGTISGLQGRGVPTIVIAFGLFVVSAAAITPVAWLSRTFVELPGIALGRRLSRAPVDV